MSTGAVIVTYNPQLSDLNILVKNISATVKEVVFVDNGSKNITEIQELIQRNENLSILLLQENKGIGYAQNRGIEHLFHDPEIEGVVLFDHDSHPEPDMIPVLTREYKRLTAEGIKVGGLGPVFVDPRTDNHYPISVFSGFSLHKKYPSKDDNNPLEASFLISSGCYIPRKVLEEVGYMNEGLFIDYIDIEWGFRAVSKGYKMYASPQAKMFHQVGDSRIKILGREISVHSPLRRYYLARNSIFMLRGKDIDWRYKVRELFFSLSRVVVFVAVVDKKRTYLKYIFRGWYDGLLGRQGACSLIHNNKS